MKKTIILLTLIFIFIIKINAIEQPIAELQIDYLHTDSKNKIDGRSVEYIIKDNNILYKHTKLYDKEDLPYKNRIITYDER